MAVNPSITCPGCKTTSYDLTDLRMGYCRNCRAFTARPDQVPWWSIAPADAMTIDLSVALHIAAPMTTMGERCPWPWEPQQLVSAPMGQYHCPYCGEMVLAGVPHVDYRED